MTEGSQHPDVGCCTRTCCPLYRGGRSCLSACRSKYIFCACWRCMSCFRISSFSGREFSTFDMMVDFMRLPISIWGGLGIFALIGVARQWRSASCKSLPELLDFFSSCLMICSCLSMKPFPCGRRGEEVVWIKPQSLAMCETYGWYNAVRYHLRPCQVCQTQQKNLFMRLMTWLLGAGFCNGFTTGYLL